MDTTTDRSGYPVVSSQKPSKSPKQQKPGLLINRNFALLWGGQTISVIGDFLFDTTLVLWIASQIALHQVWAPLAVSGVLLAASLPMLLMPPIAGVFVDRWDKRHTMLVMDTLRAVLILLLLLNTGIVPLPFALPATWQVGAIYAVVFLASCCAQFFNPSQMALVGDLVEEPLRPRASGLSQVTMSFAQIIGPSLATVLFFAVGVRWALVANALSFVVSLLTLAVIRAPKAARSVAPGERGHFFRELRAGMRFFFGSRVLVTLLIMAVIISMAAGALNALDYFFVTENLHAPASVYGFVGAVFGAGILIGAILSSMFAARMGVARAIGLSVAGLGVIFLVYARMTSVAPALALLFIAGGLQALLNVAVGPLVLHVTPRDLIGRVQSILQPAMTVTSLLSIALAGFLVSTALVNFHATVGILTLGPVDTVFSAAGLLALFAGIYAFIGLRGVKLATTTHDDDTSADQEDGILAASVMRAD
jgi:MFS family permease